MFKVAVQYGPLASIFLSGVGFSVCNLCVKYLAIYGYTNTAEIILTRGLSTLALSSGFIVYHRKCLRIEGTNIFGSSARITFILILRAIFGYTAYVFSFFAYQRLPIGDASVLMMTNFVFGSIAAYAVLGEPWRWQERLATFISIVGATCIARPSFVFGRDLDSHQKSPDIIGVTLALLGGMSMGFAFVCVRLLGTTAKASWTNICLMQGLITVVLIPPTMFFTGQSFQLHMEIWKLRIILFSGILGTFCVVLLTLGLQREKSALAGAMRISDVLFGFIWQVVFTSDAVHSLSFLGAVLVIASIAIVLCMKRSDMKKSSIQIQVQPLDDADVPREKDQGADVDSDVEVILFHDDIAAESHHGPDHTHDSTHMFDATKHATHSVFNSGFSNIFYLPLLTDLTRWVGGRSRTIIPHTRGLLTAKLRGRRYRNGSMLSTMRQPREMYAPISQKEEEF